MEIKEIDLNIEKTRKIIQELLILEENYSNADTHQKAFIEQASNSLLNQIIILTKSIKDSTADIKLEYPQNKKEAKKLVKQKFPETRAIQTDSGKVFIKSEDKQTFLKEMKIEQEVLKKIREKKNFPIKKQKQFGVETSQKTFELEPSSRIIRISNQIFRELSMGLSKTSVFQSLDRDLKKANIQFRLISYISLTLFLTLISLILSVGFSFLLGVENLLRNFLISLLIPITVFILMMLLPSQKADSTKKMLDNEIPFAVSNMAAIASSNIEPTKIFSIMAISSEFPAFSKESKKIVNQVNFYGYDLTTALRNVAKNTASVKFAELLNGISTNLTSGGDLSVYLNEKSKDHMLDYKLSRERYSNTIGVYSDIYTALLIAAPLLFMLLLIVISIIGTSVGGMSIQSLAIFGIGGIVILNILFLIFLNFTQPEL